MKNKHRNLFNVDLDLRMKIGNTELDVEATVRDTKRLNFSDYI